MKLRYLTPLIYPSRYANRLQVIKMSEAFSCLAGSFTLYVREIREKEDKIFKNYGIKTPFRIVPLGSSRGPLRSLRMAAKARFLIKQDQDGVWFLRDVLLAFWLSFLPDFRRVAFFFEIHTLGRFPSFILRRILKKARGIITTNTEKARRIQEQFSIEPDKILAVPNGADVNLLSGLFPKNEARRNFSLPPDKKIILWLGRPVEGRGIEILLKAASFLPKDAIIASVGGTPAEISRWHEYPGFDKIIWIEQIPYGRVPEIVGAADVVTAPFSGRGEHFIKYMSPLKALECLASGRICVLSDLPSIREIAGEEEAIFFRPDDPEDFVRAIECALLLSEEERNKMTKSARRRAESLSWDRRAEKIINFMKSAIKQ